MKRIILLVSIAIILSACATMTESRPANAETNPVSETFTLQTDNLTGEGIFLVGKGLTANISSRPYPDIPDGTIPILKFWYPNDKNKHIPGRPAHYSAWFLSWTQEEPTVTYDMHVGVEKSRLLVLLQIVELDNTNQAPEVLFSSYSGGMHCCAAITIFSQDEHENWQHTKLDGVDGYPIGATTIDGVDGNVIVLRDRIYILESGKLVDISDRDILIPYFVTGPESMESAIDE